MLEPKTRQTLDGLKVKVANMVLSDNVAGAGVAGEEDAGAVQVAGAGATAERAAVASAAGVAGEGAAACAIEAAGENAVAGAAFGSVTSALASSTAYALITGATGGLGRSLSREFACEGQPLALVGRNRKKLAALADELASEFNVDVQVFAADFAEPSAAEALAAEVKAAGVQVETLVNNAGFGYDAPFAESDIARQRALVQTNDAALMELCHAFAPDMAARGHGGILNVASIAGFVPGPYMATYYASKAFVQSFSQALRVELKSYGVHVTALCPGPVRTPFWDNADAGNIALARLTLEAPRVARAAVRALGANKPICCPGFLAKFVVFGSRFVPRTWAANAAEALQRK